MVQVPATDPGEELQEQVSLGLVASDAETLRHKSFPACTPEELAALARTALAEAAAGRLRPVIGQEFPLAEAARAHAAIESRQTIGKTLLTVR